MKSTNKNFCHVMTPNDTIYNNSVLKLYFRYNNIIFYEIIQLK